jgi:hypothetical protein
MKRSLLLSLDYDILESRPDLSVYRVSYLFVENQKNLEELREHIDYQKITLEKITTYTKAMLKNLTL